MHFKTLLTVVYAIFFFVHAMPKRKGFGYRERVNKDKSNVKEVEKEVEKR